MIDRSLAAQSCAGANAVAREADLVRRRLVVDRVRLEAQRRVARRARRQLDQRMRHLTRFGGARRVGIMAAQAIRARVVLVEGDL